MRKIVIFSFCILFFALFSVGQIPFASANVIDDLKAKIDERNGKIQELEAEIKQYQNEVVGVQEQAQTLQNAVKTLDTTSKQVQTQIVSTQTKVAKTNLSIEALTYEITDKERKMGNNAEAMARTLRQLNELGNDSFLEALLSAKSISDFWAEAASIEQFQATIQDDLAALRQARTDLAAAVTTKEGEKKNLVTLQSSLSDRRTILEQTKAEKAALLKETKNEETRYRTLIAEREAQQAAFERELNDFEAQLQIAIDPNSFPTAGSTVFAWPLKNIRITQQFGGTEFAAQNPQVYGRPFHNGTDFGTPTGSELTAVLSGTVRGTGNTDAIKGCYSYGKWILIDHPNGLSTLYAHLSLIRVTPGQSVGTGDLIGYTGNTGYSTGPHLHLGTYVTKGVEIVKLGDVKKITNCGNAYIPVASYNAYLDSMSYLPTL